jgi:signal transduction histidine kinase
MSTPATALVSLQITMELDVITARQRARDAAQLVGLDQSNQIRVATAVSDVARLALQRSEGRTRVDVTLGDWGGAAALVIVFSAFAGTLDVVRRLFDQGSEARPAEAVSALRLMDAVEVVGADHRGVQVRLVKRLPTSVVTSGLPDPAKLARDLAARAPHGLYEELRRQSQELMRTLEELRAREQELVRVNTELEAFSFTLSHDLRAPLRAIDGFSSALEEDCGAELDDVARRHLRDIRGGVGRMRELITSMLDLARLTSTDMHGEAVDLADMARERLDELSRAAAGARRVESLVSRSLPAYGDRALLRSVVDNLIDNAWKFTSTRDVARIEVGRTETDRGTAHFVRDNGVGFDAVNAQRLFTPFQRFHSETEFGGTGIGLVSALRIVARHGGQLWVESAIGEGATFFFQLGRE